ncbi:DUF1722 domain-containing protein [Parashewanella spongiae]|uniref:DUF1722 domain-containing protein n=1 Tax=Parashewanella spongiae TaxID=342950 RepID=A0A3A6TSQ7_9GAMM|nr:DUF523 and DUF1722 domain-containing protein [Parashewanella spongiae]MCL1076849.1 DUF523 and DUF1722 domain-containing protein [Parashewanella spongiae]RJY19217.1 DUF1722 domain-containing protein [Parashewanella spongiae]
MVESSHHIKVGISSCLLGAKVRFDSGHKKNSYVTNVLKDYFEFHSFCPEVEIGLGIPRESIRLVSVNDQIRCVGTRTAELDVTEDLYEISEEQKSWHQDLCGYIVKKDSPSCGMERVKIYHSGMPTKNGIGLYTKRLIENFPYLPIEEEGRLEDPHLRENFIQRVFIYSRWKAMLQEGVSISKLQKFHANHKYVLMSHNQTKAKKLGNLLSRNENISLHAIADDYLENMMQTLKLVATRKNHSNTLLHIQGYLKKHLDTDDKAELNEVIDDYRNCLLPLIVPITLLRHHFRKYPNQYITESYYMNPHPSELMLLNKI